MIFDPSRETELHTDVSSIGYGAILFQRIEGGLRVVSYFSRRTTNEESRYHSYELETLAIVNALKYFRVYLLGIQFKIITDCNAIKATKNKKHLLPRVARWWVYLQDFNFDIEYRKGKCIEHVDFLSRNPPPDSANSVVSADTCNVNVVSVESWLQVAQRNDKDTIDLIERVKAKDAVISDYEVVNDLLCRKLCSDKQRTLCRYYVPKGSRFGLSRLYHDENSHVGSKKVYGCIARKFWFPQMRSFVKKYVGHCLTCTVSKREVGPKQGLLHSIKKTPIPFDTIHCDCVGPFPRSKDGYQHILIMVDAFTKYLQLIPLKSLTGGETLQVFRERLTLFGRPRVIVLDRGTNFTYKSLQVFLEKQNVQLHLIATGAPRANGQAERYVGTVTNLLTAELSKISEWPSKMNKVQESLNTTVQSSTGFSPYRLLFGIERSAGNAVHAEADLPNSGEEINLNQDREVAFKRLVANAEKQDRRFNKKRRTNVEFKQGDTVFIKPAATRNAKLEKKYEGPFVISEVLTNDRYEIIGKSGRPQVAPMDRWRRWDGELPGDLSESEEDESPE